MKRIPLLFMALICIVGCHAQSVNGIAAPVTVTAPNIVPVAGSYIPSGALCGGTPQTAYYCDPITHAWAAIPSGTATIGTTPGVDILGQGSGALSFPAASFPTYFAGFVAPTSGSPNYVFQMSGVNPSGTGGLMTYGTPVLSTIPLLNASGTQTGTTSAYVVPLTPVASSGDPSQLAYLNGTNNFTVPSGCTGSTVFQSINGVTYQCGGNIFHANFEQWNGASTYTIFKTITSFTHIAGNSGTPTTAVGAGSSACTLAGNDVDFTLTVTGNGTAGTLCTVTFGQAYVSTAPRIVFSPANAASAAAMTSVYDTTALANMTFTTAAALTGSLVWNFHVAN